MGMVQWTMPINKMEDYKNGKNNYNEGFFD